MKTHNLIKASLLIFLSGIFLIRTTSAQENILVPESLKVGEKAPEFKTVSHHGKEIELTELLKKGPVVIYFYRGAWCPYCNRQMSELQDSLDFIIQKGATVLAITPENDESIDKTIEKTKASFQIIHDRAYKIMLAYKTAFKLDEKTARKYKMYGINIEKANGNEDNILPVPATYVIGKDGVIKFSFFNTDYKRRASVKEVLEHLE